MLVSREMRIKRKLYGAEEPEGSSGVVRPGSNRQ
jgi:hypothetical protein